MQHALAINAFDSEWVAQCSEIAVACCAGPDGKPVQAQVVPVSNTTKELQDLMQAEGIVPNLEAAAAHALVFLAHVLPLG